MMTIMPPASAAEALAMLTSAASYLAAADPTQLSTEAQARCLDGLERAGAIQTAVLEALSAPCGAEDDRSHAQQYHDALAEAMHRLVSAGLLPERAGQPAKVQAHISLADLMVLDGSSLLQQEWTERVRARWAGHRAAASVADGDGAAWLDGDAAEGFACDASMTPVVTGEVSYAVLEDLVQLCVRLAAHGQHASPPAPVTPQAPRYGVQR